MKNFYQTIVNLIVLLFVIHGLISAQSQSDQQQMQADQKAKEFFDQMKGQNLLNPESTIKHELTGKAAGDWFGSAVSSAGDVNGDGYDDIIIGAYQNDDGGINAGKAYLFYGGSPMNYVADIIFTGEIAYDRFGVSVSKAGDVNCDGYDDVIIGASYNDDVTSNAGKAYIYYGGITMDNAADVTIFGEAENDYFGHSVSAAGDVNGDGCGDVIIGAYGNDDGGTNAGKAYVYYGGITMDNMADVTMAGEAEGDYYGYSVSEAGDVNSDGFDDVIISAYGNDNGGTNSGKVYIYYGGSVMNATVDVWIYGEAANDFFGYSVSGTGDINGDGFADVIVGAYGNDEAGSVAGKVYIYYGGSPMDWTADVTITGEALGDAFGVFVSAAGDINGDGYGDIIVGAHQNDDGGTSAGKAYIYYGGEAMNTVAEMTVTGEAATDYLGLSCALAGDVNGDGYADVIIGARGNDDGGTDAGKVYIFMQTLSGHTNYANVTMIGEAAYNDFGNCVSTAGDVNGDGYDDVIIAARDNDDGGNNAGKAYIYYGGVYMNNTADVTMTGEAEGDFFGYSVSAAGDVNGDGYDDVIIGAYRNDDAGSDVGKSYIYFGGAAMDNSADVTMTGEGLSDLFGISVSGAGDVNGDGYCDVIIGAYLNDDGGNLAGKTYIYYGGSAMDNSADVTMTGEAANEFFGQSVSAAGDVNGDGYSDVIVGAHHNDVGGSRTGKAYVYYGGTAMDNLADVIMIGEAIDDRFGRSVSTAGDLNGDGFDDVIIGANRNDENGYFAGKVYIYLGGLAMDSTADLTMTGEMEWEWFGTSVSNAGDINADGYGDVIIGAFNNDYSGFSAGKTYIYYGGNIMDDIADVTMSGEVESDNFGLSVSTAGDVNSDGYADVVIGAEHNDDGGTDAGKVYIYFSAALSIKPNLFYAADVPHDQGGYVKIKWSRCAYDNRITKYMIQGSGPKNNSNYAWENIAEIIPTYDPYYSYTAKTNYDSTSQSPALFYYRISALSNNNGEIWRSEVKSAYSVDNISPSGVSQMLARQIGNHSVITEWEQNTIDTDFSHYAVHRSDVDGFQPSGSTLLATTTDTFYIDPSPVDLQNTYYRVVTYDIHENPSPPSVQANIFFDSSLPVFMSSFTADMLSNGLVQINFITASEIELMGFNVWRSNQADGGYSKIASYLDHKELRSKGSSAAGSEYSWNDATVESNHTYYYKLEAADMNGSSEFIGPVSIKVNYLPVEFVLHQNFPNPFNPETYIPYELPVTSDVEIIIYNSIGQKIKSYKYIDKPAGIYKQKFMSKNSSSGMYFYIINASGKETEKERTYNKVMKMLLIK